MRNIILSMLGLGITLWPRGSGGASAPLFIFLGESNSGGVVPNADASAPELAARTAVKIWHNTANEFQSLDIGTNNLISHTSLANNTTHSWENGLAGAVEIGRLTQSQVYLLKSGQGGSAIQQWESADASGYWDTFVARYDAAVAAMAEAGKTPVHYVWLTIGINDAVNFGSGSPYSTAANYKTKLTDLIARIRTLMGATTPVILTLFEPPMVERAGYNTAMTEIAAADDYTWTVSSIGADAMVDGNHWEYAGNKLMADRLLDASFVAAGNSAASSPSISPAAGEYATSQEVTITAASALQIRYTTDGSDPLGGTVYTGPFTPTFPLDVKAVAIETGKPSSSIVTNAYTLDTSVLLSAVDAAANSMTLSDGGLTIVQTNSAWKTCRVDTLAATDKAYVEFKAKIGATNGNFMFGFANSGFAASSYLGTSNYSSCKAANGSEYRSSGFADGAGGGSVPVGNGATNDVWAMAIDRTAGKIWYYKNGVARGTGDASAGTDPDETFTPGTTGALYAAISLYNLGGTWTLQSAAADQDYSPPSGFTAWG